jgi:hypothetical protein
MQQNACGRPPSSSPTTALTCVPTAILLDAALELLTPFGYDAAWLRRALW